MVSLREMGIEVEGFESLIVPDSQTLIATYAPNFDLDTALRVFAATAAGVSLDNTENIREAEAIYRGLADKLIVK